MSTKQKIPKPPKWLVDYRARNSIAKIIDMAYDRKFSDKDVRFALIEASGKLDELGKIAEG